MDRALSLLAQDVFDDAAGVAIVAVGGYGRGELSPHSDIDLLITASKQRELDRVTPRLRHLLYPLWDAGLKVGHATLDTRDAIVRARTDVHALTAALNVRHVAGSRSAFEEFVDRRDRAISHQRKRFIQFVLRSVAERHRAAGEAGWMLAPDIKNDRGGLRDRAATGWIATLVGANDNDPEMEPAAELLLAVREMLHRFAGRCYDRLRPDLQEQIAPALGMAERDGAYRLMAAVHAAARVIETTSAERIATLAATVTGGPRRSGNHARIASDLRAVDGEIYPAPEAAPTMAGVLRAFRYRAETGAPLAPAARRWVRNGVDEAAEALWTEEMRTSFLALLAAPHVETALRELEQAGALRSLIPGWSGVRGLSADDLYHQHTVDAHSFRCVAEVARVIEEEPLARNAMEEVGDLTNLLMAALLHDIGKGRGGDHAVEGAGLATVAAHHMGFSRSAVDAIAHLVRYHLLLADTATRRDLDDGAVVAEVAELLEDAGVLKQLYVLTHADSRATGPQAWSSWKAGLVLDLYRKTLTALEQGSLPPPGELAERVRELAVYDPLIAASAEDILAGLPPSYLETDVGVMSDELRMLSQRPQPGEVLTDVRPHGDVTTITICTTDRPGALARAAGVLTLHRIAVRSARIFTSADGSALQRFSVHAPDDLDHEALRGDLQAASSGRLPLEARAAVKIRDYAGGSPLQPDIRMLADVSDHSTVIELRAPDRLGLLYAAASAFADLGIDIHVAKIDTMGERVVDVFYVRSIAGEKLDEPQMLSARTAMEHRLASLFGAG